MTTPKCYGCAHRQNVPGDAHSACGNHEANVTALTHGIVEGWFFWPFNFDPVWLTSCDGFQEKKIPKLGELDGLKTSMMIIDDLEGRDPE